MSAFISCDWCGHRQPVEDNMQRCDGASTERAKIMEWLRSEGWGSAADHILDCEHLKGSE